MTLFNPENFLILIVDDLKINLQLLSAILEKQKYKIISANSGKKALELLQTVKPNLILLDLMMPHMDGLEVCEHLKANPNLKDIPVIFLTASHDEDDLLKAFELGAIDFVTKPFRYPELLARVQTHLELKETRDELQRTLEELVEARDKAIDAARIKSQFLANMSHEIRTPMNAIMGMTEVLLNSNLDSEQIDCLETIKSGGEDLVSIINDILDFSKLEAGGVRLNPDNFDIQSTMEDLINLFTPVANKKQLKLSCYIESEIPRYLYGDRLRLRQILTNLIGNALKFTDSGQIKVCICCHQNLLSESLVKLRFEVKDSGIGIPESAMDQLFKSFSQVDDSISGKYGGTGLGLAICKQLVQLMEGEIGVDSVINEGSTFWFTANFQLSNVANQDNKISNYSFSLDSSQEVEKIEKQDQESLDKTKDVKILLVEDTPINQKVFLYQLQVIGYTADVVNNGFRAIDSILENDYDLVLMDCQMPILDGYQATTQLRQFKGNKRNTIIIGLTAYAMESDRQKCLDAGMNDYLSKPVTLKQLSATIEKWAPENAVLKDKKNVNVDKNVEKKDPVFRLPIPSIESPVTLERLDQFTNSNAKFELEVLQSFVAEIERYLKDAKLGLDTKDLNLLLHKAHQIKGSAANMGIKYMPELAGKIEQYTLKNDWEKVNQDLLELENIRQQVIEYIQEAIAMNSKLFDSE